MWLKCNSDWQSIVQCMLKYFKVDQIRLFIYRELNATHRKRAFAVPGILHSPKCKDVISSEKNFVWDPGLVTLVFLHLVRIHWVFNGYL